jgi:hypothetical protein
MPAKIKPVEPDYVDDPLAEHRDRLHNEIALRNNEADTLKGLQEASGRAREERWAAGATLSNAQDALRQAKAEEPAALARAYAAGEQGEATAERAQSSVDRMRAEMRR